MSWRLTGWSWWRSQDRLVVKLRPLRSLRGPGEAALLARILAVAVVAPLLARFPLSRLEAVLEPRRLRRSRPAVTDVAAERLVALVDLAIRVGTPLVRPGCLTRAVTSYWFLRRAGQQVSLVFGIDASRAAATGHCWLEVGRQPRFEKADPRAAFATIASIPTRA